MSRVSGVRKYKEPGLRIVCAFRCNCSLVECHDIHKLVMPVDKYHKTFMRFVATRDIYDIYDIQMKLFGIQQCRQFGKTLWIIVIADLTDTGFPCQQHLHKENFTPMSRCGLFIYNVKIDSRWSSQE